MPVTPAHVAAILPGYGWLRQRRLVSAAAIGAMCPDAGLFLPGRLDHELTHSYASLLTFCLPVGLFVWMVFQGFIKPALIEVLPDSIYARFCAAHGLTSFGFKRWIGAAAAIVLAGLTHDVWDGLTHREGVGHRLQDASSILGLLVLCGSVTIWVCRCHATYPRPARALGARERRRWAAFCLWLPVVSMGLYLAAPLHGWSGAAHQDTLAGVITVGIRDTALSMVLTSALVRRRLLVDPG